MKSVHRNTIRLAVLISLLVTGGAVLAQQTPQSNLAISAGVFPTSFSTSARLSSGADTGNSVDLENDLGLQSHLSNVWIEGMWRFKPRHSLVFGYTSWRRSADKTLERSFDWQGKQYDAGATVGAANNAQFIKLGYQYAITRSDTTEFDVTGAIDALWNKTSVEGEATITDAQGNKVTGNYKAEESFIAPVPVLGFNVVHMATPKVVVRGTAEFFWIHASDTKARVSDLRGSADYLFSPSWSAGAGYSYIGYRVERPRFVVRYGFSGPIVYVSYRR